MNATNRYLDAVKAKTGAPSDYAVAAILGCTRQQISKYRNKGEYLGDEPAMKAAQILEIDPLIILAEIQAEKAKCEPAKAVWKSLYEKLGGIAAAVVLGIAISSPTPSNAATARDCGGCGSNQCILCQIRRRRNNPLGMLLSNLLPTPRLVS